ncbi:MAG TPA: hypothetical protein VLD63_13380 [Anaerolineales bacterium]|nr:hypothetical protein [Anaerolineales bacterium]
MLGTGCFKCIDLERLLSEVLEETVKSNVAVERVSDDRRLTPDD